MVQNQMLFLPILVSVQLAFSVKNRISVMNDTVMVGAYDNLVACIIVEALYEIINMMSFCNMGTEFLANQLSANLAAISVQEL